MRALVLVHLSCDVGCVAGARSVTGATAAGRLLAGTSEAIGKRLRAAPSAPVAARSRAGRLGYQYQVRTIRGLMLAAADIERRRIATDIYDDAKQHLSVLRTRVT